LISEILLLILLLILVEVLFLDSLKLVTGDLIINSGSWAALLFVLMNEWIRVLIFIVILLFVIKLIDLKAVVILIIWRPPSDIIWRMRWLYFLRIMFIHLIICSIILIFWLLFLIILFILHFIMQKTSFLSF